MDGVELLRTLLCQAMEGRWEGGAQLEQGWLAQKSGIQVVEYRQGEFPAHTGQLLGGILLQLAGQASVLKYSRQGGLARSGALETPQIYGLYELLNHIGEHTATIQADGPLVCARVPLELYREALKQDHEVALLSLRFLAGFTARMLEQNDKLSLNTARQNLLLFLRDACRGKALPYTIPEKKADIAELLSFNLRSLYRQLRKLEQEGLLTRNKGKIQIGEKALQSIEHSLLWE